MVDDAISVRRKLGAFDIYLLYTSSFLLTNSLEPTQNPRSPALIPFTIPLQLLENISAVQVDIG